MLKEFRDFAMKGSMLDLAIGVILGAAFGKVVASMVADILMPPIGMVLGRVDFSSLFVSLTGQPYPSVAAAKAAGAPTLNYGLFVNTVIEFAIVGFVLFLIIRSVNRMRGPAPAAAPATTECPHCKSTIPFAATRCPHCTSQLR